MFQFCSLINFQSLNRHWSVLLRIFAPGFALSDSPSTWPGADKRQDKMAKGVGGGGGWLFERGDYFNISIKGAGGDYSREATNRGTANIRGNTVYKPKFVAHRFELVSEARKTNQSCFSVFFFEKIKWYLSFLFSVTFTTLILEIYSFILKKALFCFWIF